MGLLIPAPAPSFQNILWSSCQATVVYSPHCIPGRMNHCYIDAWLQGTERQQKGLPNFIIQEYLHFGHEWKDKQIFKMEAEDQVGENRCFLSLYKNYGGRRHLRWTSWAILFFLCSLKPQTLIIGWCPDENLKRLMVLSSKANPSF